MPEDQAEKPKLILRPGDPTVREEGVLENPEFRHRKEVRQRVRTNALSKLQDLLDLNKAREEIRGEKVEERFKIEADDLEQVEAREIYERISQKKRDDPKASLFRLINEELEKYRGLQPNEAGGHLPTRVLLDTREIITDAAREEEIWKESENLLLEAEDTNDYGVLLKNLHGLQTRSPSLDRKAIGINQAEDRVPYYDFAGIVEEHMRIAEKQAELFLLEAKGEEYGDTGRELRSEIGMFGWGTPPLFLREKAKRYIGPEREKLEGEEERMQAMAERLARRDEREYPASPPPKFFVALFRQSREGMYEPYWKDKVAFLDITEKSDRDKWALLNMEAFNGGIISSPHKVWKAVIDEWLSHSLDATRLTTNLNREQTAGVKESEREIKDMMAISAAARAMEQTAGTATSYVEFMVGRMPDGSLDTDKQDGWADFLLAGDPEKYWRVVNNPLVKDYYERVKRDAGITVDKEAGEEGNKGSEFRITGNPGKLVEYLATQGVDGYKGGFDAYIEEELLAKDTEGFIEEQESRGLDSHARWSAAKLACDAFLVDKYTRWEWRVVKGVNPNSQDNLRLKPFSGWGGDPFKAIVEPAFLPRRIKGVYKGEDSVILTMIDNAFRPEIFREDYEQGKAAHKGELKSDAVMPSAVENLKKYYRFNSALWMTIGNSMAEGLPEWSRETLESLKKTQGLLFQVYGKAKSEPKKEGEESDVVGPEVVGAMMSRILEVKALALAVESQKPGFRQNLRAIFGREDVAHPFYEVEQFIFGKDLDYRDGLVASMAGGRTRLVFRNNKYGAERSLNNTWRILSTNDQSLRKGTDKVVEGLGFLASIFRAASGGKRR